MSILFEAHDIEFSSQDVFRYEKKDYHSKPAMIVLEFC